MKPDTKNSVYRNRCDKLAEAAKAAGIDAVLLKSMPSFRYFSGFTGDNGMLLIAKDSRTLFTDFRYTEQAQSQAKDFSIAEFKRGGELALVAEQIRAQRCGVLGIEETVVSVADYAKLQQEFAVSFRPVDTLVASLRRVKDSYEIEATRKAAELADLAFSYLLDFIEPGMSEIDIALELEFFVRKNGASDVSFSPIVASGPNGALPHAQPSMRKISVGDLVTLDFGCIVDGYCSDMTRTVGIGNIASDQKNIYTICLEAQLAALSALRAGIAASKVDAVARGIIERAGFGKHFGHGLGHGTGIEIHESPTLSPSSADLLEVNNIVTVEPGIYVTGLGGVRIEDLCVVTADGFVNLSASPKELILL